MVVRENRRLKVKQPNSGIFFQLIFCFERYLGFIRIGLSKRITDLPTQNFAFKNSRTETNGSKQGNR
jgi:hypothetical protein